MDLLRIQLVIGYAGVINGIAISVYLLFSKIGNINSNRILGLFIAAITIKISYAITSAQMTGHSAWVFNLIAISGYYSIGPMMFLFFQSVLKKLPENNLFIILHFLPAIYVMFLLTDKLPYFILNLWITQGQIAVYLILAFGMLYKIKTNKTYAPFKSEFINLRNVFVGIFSFWLCVFWLIISDFQTIYLVELGVLFTILLYGLVYSTFKNKWYRQGEVIHSKQTEVNVSFDEYKLKSILEKADNIMETTKCFENPEINLPKLAQLINESTHNLSESINKIRCISFNDYINSFRIEKAKQLLQDPDYFDSKIAGIAYDCGFNTLSTFNLAFKKFTNTTPSKFRESVLITA